MTTATTNTIPTQAQPVAEIGHEHGSRIVTALEEAWAAIRAVHPEVPEVVMITGTGRSGSGIKWGHFGADFWTVEKDEKKRRAPELFAGGELLALGGRRVMQTLIHEAAHAVAHVRGIKDTSSSGRYHNKRFVAIAEEMGLTPPTEPDLVRGFSECIILDATATRYAKAVEALDAARLPYVYDPLAIALGGGSPRPGGDDDEDQGEGEGGSGQEEPEPVEKPKKRPPTRFLVICGCTKPGKDGKPEPARRIQISRATWEFGQEEGEEGGALTCGRCSQPFRKAQQDEGQTAG